MDVRPLHTSLPMAVSRPPDGHGRHWATLTRDVSVSVCGLTYTVPAGYEFDGATIPWVGWLAVGTPLEWPFCYAACIHDACYTGDLWHAHAWGARRAWFPPMFAHQVFRELLVACGVAPWRAWACWGAVALWGLAWGHRHSYTLPTRREDDRQ